MKENNKSFVTVIVIIAVLVVGYIIGISYANKKAREVVDANIARMEQRLAAKGTDATITYDDVKVHGMTLRPRASVYGLHVKLDDKARRRETHIAVPEVVYVPHNFFMTHYTFEAIDGVSITNTRRGTSEGVLLDFSSPPAVTVNEKAGEGRAYSMYVPLNITMTDTSETGEATADKTDVTFASEPQVSWTEDDAYNTLDQQAVFPRIVVSQNGEELASADGFTATTKHSALADGRTHYDTLVKLENLVFADEDLKVLNPVSVVNEVSYSGVVPAAEQTAEQAEPQPVDITVKNIAVMSGLMSLFANGDLHFGSSEKMPSGKLLVRFDDLDAFLDYVSQQRPNTAAYMQKVRAALEKLSGTTIEQGGSVTINLMREANGRLEVGEMTLEEALGMFIELAMEVPDFSAPQQELADESAGDEAAEETTNSAPVTEVEEEMVDEAQAETMQEEMAEDTDAAAESSNVDGTVNDAVDDVVDETAADAEASVQEPAASDDGVSEAAAADEASADAETADEGEVQADAPAAGEATGPAATPEVVPAQ